MERKPFIRISCLYCDGEGYYEDADDYTASKLECANCEGTGDRFGRGPTLPPPDERIAPAMTDEPTSRKDTR